MAEQFRQVTHPMVDGFTDEHLIVIAGPDGAGQASHLYKIFTVDNTGSRATEPICIIQLQEGHPKEVGVNGIGNQTLMLILQDFLRKVNAGEFSCRENSVQLTKIEEAMQWSKQRELDRKQRGVLQTYKK
jgi:hypothetical protein